MKTKRRRSAIVPRVVFGTLCVGVIPICVLECSNGSGGSGGGNGCPSYGCLGVAAVGYDALGVFVGFDTSTGEASHPPDGVADVGFHTDAAGDAASDAPTESGDGGQTG